MPEASREVRSPFRPPCVDRRHTAPTISAYQAYDAAVKHLEKAGELYTAALVQEALNRIERRSRLTATETAMSQAMPDDRDENGNRDERSLFADPRPNNPKPKCFCWYPEDSCDVCDPEQKRDRAELPAKPDMDEGIIS
jgi:hypothetical protein